MTLRLTQEQTEALRQRAELESRSMQEVACCAIMDYIEKQSRADLLNAVLDREIPRFREALDRLAQ